MGGGGDGQTEEDCHAGPEEKKKHFQVEHREGNVEAGVTLLKAGRGLDEVERQTFF